MGNRVRIASRYNAPSSTHLNRNYSAAGTPAPVPTFFTLRERLRWRTKFFLQEVDREIAHENLWKILLGLSHNAHSSIDNWLRLPLGELFTVASYLGEVLGTKD